MGSFLSFDGWYHFALSVLNLFFMAWSQIMQFFSIDSLFSRLVPPLSRPFLLSWLVVAVGLLVVGFGVAWWVSRAKFSGPLRRWWRGVGNRLITFGLLAAVLLVFRYEQAPVLGSRFWIVLWGLGVIISFGRHLWYRQFTLPVQLSEYDRRARLGRYLPK